MSEKEQLEPDDWKALSRLLDTALDLPSAARRAWLDGLSPEDAVHRAALEEILAAHSRANAEGFLASRPSLDVVEPGGSIGPYRLEREIGRGGMGTVWLAERSDGRFQRSVAIKLLSMAVRGAVVEERFRREGRILGALVHPHIAELLDAGVTAEGRPYLVLEFVDGEPIDAYCRRLALDVPARIRLFRDVLAAVAHAHANLIVHRDIKPSNVFVRKDGQVKLLDFGIAKLMEQGGRPEATLTGEAGPMTPMHAAPEQLKGEPVTTATDVYALGVLLHVLLVGEHPAGKGPHAPMDLMRKLVETEPPLLSHAAEVPDRLRRQLRGDLDTIVARALKKAPVERYASVTAFDEDLRRYLRNEPIRARPDTLLYRTSKFLSRNRVAVAGVALATVALGVTAGVAIRKAIDARDRFEQVRKMAHTFLFDFYDELDRVDGTTKAKELVVSTASEYLDNLARSAGDDRALLRELAEAYERLAEVQGGSLAGNLNQRNAGLENRRRAIEIRKRMAGEDRQQDEKLVILMLRATDDLRNQGRMDEALAMGRQAVEAGDALVRGTPDQVFVSVGSAHGNLGRVFQDLGRYAEAEAEFETAEKLTLSAEPGKVGRALVGIRLDRADTLHGLGRLVEAVRLLEQVEQDYDRLVEEAEPGGDLRRAQRSRQVVYATLAMVYDNPLAPSLDQPEQALLYRDKLRNGWQEFIDADPNDESARQNLAIGDSEAAVTLLKLDPRAAVEMAAMALAVFERIEAAKPDDLHLAFRSARGANRLALALLADGRPEEARTVLEPSLRKHRTLLAQEDNSNHRYSLVWTLTVTGRAERLLGHDDLARITLEEAVESAERLLPSEALPHLRAVAEAYQEHAEAVAGEERCRSLRRVHEVWSEWKAATSPWVDARRKEAGERAAACPLPT